jgi:tetratricopeptide (TPR) repeat protein
MPENAAELLDRRLCDSALATYQSIPRENWKGQLPFPGGELIFGDSERSRAYLAAGIHALEINRDSMRGIALLDISIRLDQESALEEGENIGRRMLAFKALGNDAPYRSVMLYELGLAFQELGQWREAGSAYFESARLDPGFVWPLNNFAWMAATAVDPAAHNGSYAVASAERACVLSQWACKSFLGTLAASYARAGDFGRAVAWQRIALELEKPEARDQELARLKAFTEGRAFVDHHPAPIGGGLSAKAVASLDLESLREQLRKLSGRPTAQLH